MAQGILTGQERVDLMSILAQGVDQHQAGDRLVFDQQDARWSGRGRDLVRMRFGWGFGFGEGTGPDRQAQREGGPLAGRAVDLERTAVVADDPERCCEPEALAQELAQLGLSIEAQTTILKSVGAGAA